VLDAVFRGIRPPTGVYVSCNPEALATDLAHIVECGYRVDSIQPIDMFPHTPHIETVVVVSR
jgi:23S rRNA (uracil1939-C5)-methyltransferase